MWYECEGNFEFFFNVPVDWGIFIAGGAAFQSRLLVKNAVCLPYYKLQAKQNCDYVKPCEQRNTKMPNLHFTALRTIGMLLACRRALASLVGTGSKYCDGWTLHNLKGDKVGAAGISPS